MSRMVYIGRPHTGRFTSSTSSVEEVPKAPSLATMDFAVAEVRLGHLLAHRPSPYKAGWERCMDCRCGGFGCPGQPPGTNAKWREQLHRELGGGK